MFPYFQNVIKFPYFENRWNKVKCLYPQNDSSSDWRLPGQGKSMRGRRGSSLVCSRGSWTRCQLLKFDHLQGLERGWQHDARTEWTSDAICFANHSIFQHLMWNKKHHQRWRYHLTINCLLCLQLLHCSQTLLTLLPPLKLPTLFKQHYAYIV